MARHPDLASFLTYDGCFAGKGFAVVANEVKSLAVRSKEAALQINRLITAAGERVSKGSAYVESAGDAMNDIIVSVNQVSGIVGDISESATLQTYGIERVNSALAQLGKL